MRGPSDVRRRPTLLLSSDPHEETDVVNLYRGCLVELGHGIVGLPQPQVLSGGGGGGGGKCVCVRKECERTKAKKCLQSNGCSLAQILFVLGMQILFLILRTKLRSYRGKNRRED